MSRRKKTGASEALMEAIARLPWWAGVALAVLSYVLLHRMANQPIAPTPTQPGQIITHVMTQSVWRGLATVGQFVLPLICLGGSIASVVRRRSRAQLVDRVAHGASVDVLNGMSWQQFEQLVSEAFRLQGYRVTETGGGGADGGVDLALTKDGDLTLVQCKQWRAYKVDVKVVRELYGVMAACGATAGVVVTSGRFTNEATDFAEGLDIRLIDGAELHQWIRATRPSTSRLTSLERVNDPRPDTVASHATPACPTCAKPMVQRMAKRGPHAGQSFWGCTDYPACRGTRAVV